jgi:hypothetical protein
VIELCHLLVGTIAATIHGEGGKSIDPTQIDFSGVRIFLMNVGRDICIDPERGWWICHVLAGMITKLKDVKLAAVAEKIDELLTDVVDFCFDVNAQNQDGNTFLHMLAPEDNPVSRYAAIWLIQHAPVDTKIRNQEELTALELCEKAGMLSDRAEFTVKLEKKTDEASLGLNLSQTGAATTVEGVNTAGLAADWNRSNKDSVIKVGDRIICVNGVSDRKAMVKECKESTQLEISFERGYKDLLLAFERGPAVQAEAGALKAEIQRLGEAEALKAEIQRLKADAEKSAGGDTPAKAEGDADEEVDGNTPAEVERGDADEEVDA